MQRRTQAQMLELVQEYIRVRQSDPKLAIVYKPSTDSWDQGGRARTSVAIARTIGIELGISRDMADNLLAEIAQRYCDAMEEALSRKIIKNDEAPECDKELRKFISLMQHKETTSLMHECHVWAFKQWIWQVKRHCVGLEVTHHNMLIFYSAAGGTGKSLNMKRLCEWLGPWQRSMEIDQLGENFSSVIMSQTRIIRFDEMSGVRSAKAATFKSFITGRRFEGRMMRSQAGFSGANRISCIATTNEPPPHGIEDSSGARRLWTMHCLETPNSVDPRPGQELDQINWQAVWQAISHEHDSVEQMVPKHIKKAMYDVRERILRTKPSFEAFLVEEVEQVEGAQPIRLSEVQRAYQAYCRLCHTPPMRMNRTQLAQRLKKEGFDVVNHSNVLKVNGLRLLNKEEFLP